ncbi:MAG TPA: MgtC/SapB family protein [Vicinamibacteria bacterium]|nr:MgtC/SapB family protein [Vicinamibacteria bacterium]
MMEDSVVLRLTLAVLLGALVGVERQWHHKIAGLKTHALVTTGAAAFAVLSQLGLGPGGSPVQIAAGVVTGIGFIGGGVIMRRGASVQGINTAATLWAAGGLGLALGGGHYRVAGAVLLAILLTEIPLRSLALWIDRRSDPPRTREPYRLLVDFDLKTEEDVRAALARASAAQEAFVSEHGETRDGAGQVLLELRVRVPADRPDPMRGIGATLCAVPGVKKTEWSRCAEDERE